VLCTRQPGHSLHFYTPELLPSKVGPERILHCETVTQDLATDPEFPADTDGLALDTILLASADT
jgi:hypothetical protein